MIHSKAVKDVISERKRQQSVEGWTPDHDDTHTCGELALAASCYATVAAHGVVYCPDDTSKFKHPELWPWGAADAWNPKNPRRDLVRAAALIIAEIERLDRARKKIKETEP